MTATKWIGLILGASAVYWIYNKSKFADSLTYLPTSLKVGGSILNPEIILGVKIYNPSNVSTSFSNLNSELFLENGQKVADVYYNQKLDIPAKSSVNILLTANTTFSNLATSVAELIKSKKANFKIKGIASIDSITLPFTIDYKFFG
jgi:LEA14-like dessication related protein